MRRKAHELGVLEQLAADRPLILDDHRLHLIEEQFCRHAAKERERVFQSFHQAPPSFGACRTATTSAASSPTRPATHSACPRAGETQRNPPAPDGPGGSFEAHNRIGQRRRPYPAHVFLNLRVAAERSQQPGSHRRGGVAVSLGNSASRVSMIGLECIDLARNRTGRGAYWTAALSKSRSSCPPSIQ